MYFMFVGKMQHIHKLVKKSSRKLASRGGGRRIDIHNVNTMIAGAGLDSSSQQVVEVADDDNMEVEASNSLKGNRVEPVDKGKNVPVKVVPLRSEGEDLLQLLNVRSDPDRYGPHSTICRSDLKLKVIQDLGTAGRGKTAMTKGYSKCLHMHHEFFS